MSDLADFSSSLGSDVANLSDSDVTFINAWSLSDTLPPISAADSDGQQDPAVRAVPGQEKPDLKVQPGVCPQSFSEVKAAQGADHALSSSHDFEAAVFNGVKLGNGLVFGYVMAGK